MAFSFSGLAQAKDNTAPVSAEAALSASPNVKKSKTGICHAQGSTYYAQTKSFMPFKTIDECLKSGGRLPKK